MKDASEVRVKSQIQFVGFGAYDAYHVDRVGYIQKQVAFVGFGFTSNTGDISISLYILGRDQVLPCMTTKQQLLRQYKDVRSVQHSRNFVRGSVSSS